jgi:hypothetical protein
MEDLDRDVNVLATGEAIETTLETALTDQGQAVATVGVDQLYGSVSARPSGDGPRGSGELRRRTHDDVALRSWCSALFGHPLPRWQSGPPGLHLARNIVSRHHLHETRSRALRFLGTPPGTPPMHAVGPLLRVFLGSRTANERETG